VQRQVILALVFPAIAAADPAPSDLGDQGIGAQLGAASGGRDTPGGLRVIGHFLYQLSDQDWFDGSVAFTFGGGGAACFHDRMGELVCDHGLADGAGIELGGAIRRMFAERDGFRPFAKLGIGLSLVRFSGDQVNGVALPLHAGGGVRAVVAPSIAVIVEGDLAVGVGSFNRGLGLEPQFGLDITMGVEFKLN
jgi:hypothetical protein